MKPAKQAALDVLVGMIETGQIESKNQLQLEILKRGWEISLYGDDFFTIKTKAFRFRLRFDFGHSVEHGWIYALIARNDFEIGCYVGSTSKFHSRMESHFNIYKNIYGHGAKTSTEFFLWASKRSLIPNVIVLEKVFGKTKLLVRENLWTKAAENIQWVLPGVERWGCQANKPIIQSPSAASTSNMEHPDFHFLDLSLARTLFDVVHQQIHPATLLLGSAHQQQIK